MKGRKLITLLLVLTMLVGISAPAFAEGKDVYRYVALGDSTTNGYGLPGFDSRACGRYSEHKDIYIVRLCDWLRNQGKNVYFKNLALTGMRVNELTYFLDRSIAYEDADAYGQMRWEEYEGCYGGSMDALRDTYISEVENADLITFELGSNNFANYTLSRVAELFGVDIGFRWGYQDDSFNELMEKHDIDISIELRNDVTKLVESATNGAVSEDMIAGIVETLLYSYANFVIGFRDSVDMIYKLNPDVKLIVLSVNNTLAGLKAKLNGTVVDLGAIWGGFMQLANLYITDKDKHNGDYFYADLSDGVESMVDAIAAGEVYPNLYNEMLDLFYSDKMLDDGAAEFIGQMAGTGKVTLAQAKNAVATGEPANVKAAVDDVIATFIKGAQANEPFDVALGVPLLLNGGFAGLRDDIRAAFTDFDSASDIGKASVYIMFFVMKNSAACHPSVNGHTQKLNAVIKAYNAPCTADGAHILQGIAFGSKILNKLFSTPDWLSMILSRIREFFASLPLPIYC